jgi:putative transcriptional regulator
MRALRRLLLLLLALAAPLLAQDKAQLSTILLVARDEIVDPSFGGSIVLVMNNIGPAPAGVIVNRPTAIPVSKLFPDNEALAHVDDKVYFGGPVELGVLSFLVRAAVPPEHATHVVDDVYLSADRDLLHELLSRDKPMAGLRIFAGYSGWGSGQLEAEIARGDWTMQPATARTIFEPRKTNPWPERKPAERERT